jgi:hypothetical protein
MPIEIEANRRLSGRPDARAAALAARADAFVSKGNPPKGWSAILRAVCVVGEKQLANEIDLGYYGEQESVSPPLATHWVVICGRETKRQVPQGIGKRQWTREVL